MFDIIYIKQKLGKRKIERPAMSYDFNLFAQSLPYYLTIPEQKWTDERFSKLTRQEKGDFSLLLDFIWRGCGAVRVADLEHLASDLEMSKNEIGDLVKKLLQVKLLVEVNGWLVQMELREQYLYVRKDEANEKLNAAADKGPVGPPFDV